jgi:hypothetical protein
VSNTRYWECTDSRDRHRSRAFRVYSDDAVAAIKNGHWSVLYLLAVPETGLQDAEVLERVVTAEPRTMAKGLLDALAGRSELRDARGREDLDVARNLRNRLALQRRTHGDVNVAFAIYYGDKVAGRTHPRPMPTDDMIDLVARCIEDEGLDGKRWRVARSLDELPAAPHGRAELAIVGVDSRGRVDTATPRPNHHTIDQWQMRDLRKLVQAVLQHPAMIDCESYCQRAGLARLFLWRYLAARRRTA